MCEIGCAQFALAKRPTAISPLSGLPPKRTDFSLRAAILVFITTFITSQLTAAAGTTEVTIRGEKFLINGSLTYAGGQLEGTLPNSRMVQATFDDANPLTVGMWKYPNGTPYNASRQTNEFVAALPSYHSHGLLAVSVNFQGGNPVTGYAGATQPWDNTAFNSDGSLKTPYLTRMDKVIRALDAQGMIAILGFFYFGQDERLTDETSVRNATINATQWVLDQGYTNVLIEVDNEADNLAYTHDILKAARVGELIRLIQTQSSNSGRRFNVAVSYSGGQIPSAEIMQAEDFILLHGNHQAPNGITSMVNTVRSFGLNKPIVFNEDSTSTANFNAATNAHVSWGYFDAGLNDYVDGFQSPPTNWSINTQAKQDFFGLLRNLARSTPVVNKLPNVTIRASSRTVSRGTDGIFTISMSSVNPSQVTTVPYSISGTAQLGTDFSLSGSFGQVAIPAGASSAGVDLHALARAGASGNATVIMTLGSTPSYHLARPKKARLTITSGP